MINVNALLGYQTKLRKSYGHLVSSIGANGKAMVWVDGAIKFFSERESFNLRCALRLMQYSIVGAPTVSKVKVHCTTDCVEGKIRNR